MGILSNKFNHKDLLKSNKTLVKSLAESFETLKNTI